MSCVLCVMPVLRSGQIPRPTCAPLTAHPASCLQKPINRSIHLQQALARSALGDDPLGPDTRELTRRSNRPILVAGSVPTPMDRVLVAFDGGPNSEMALAFGSRFAGITGAHLDVLHVVQQEQHHAA